MMPKMMMMMRWKKILSLDCLKITSKLKHLNAIHKIDMCGWQQLAKPKKIILDSRFCDAYIIIILYIGSNVNKGPKYEWKWKQKEGNYVVYIMMICV